MSDIIDFTIIIDHLLDDSQPFPARYLYTFSDIEPEHLETLLTYWPDITLQRQRGLLEDLELLAESNTLLCFDVFASALLDDPDSQVRTLAIRLLWECEDHRLLHRYRTTLKEDTDTQVRATAATALGRFIFLGELDKIPDSDLREIEQDLLDVIQSSEEKLVRRRSLEALGASSRQEVLPLIEEAYNHEDPEWVASALFAMGRSNDTRWEKYVISSLRSKYDSIRNEAIQAAGELDLKSARSILLMMLDDEEDIITLRQVIWALSKIGGSGVLERLNEIYALSRDDEEAAFIEEAIDNLVFNDQMQSFGTLDDQGLFNEED